MKKVLEAKGIVKQFPGTVALDGVDFALGEGDIHAVVGPNGAGKSTLMNIIIGSFRPDKGELFVNGREVEITSPHVSQTLGISMIHQELKLIPELSIAENIFFGRHPQLRFGVVDWKTMFTKANVMLNSIGARFSSRARVSSLSVAQRQQVEIAKALSLEARILVMDEPTASLSPKEVENLFVIMRQLKQRGVSIVYISHRLDEVLEIADTITVMRDGKIIDTVDRAGINKDQLVSMMVGRQVVAIEHRTMAQGGAELIASEELTVPGKLDRISFKLRAGEVLGIAGLVGSGRTELLQALFGVLPFKGKVVIKGHPLQNLTVAGAVKAGLGLAPEDRKREGLVLSMSIKENTTMASTQRFMRAGCFKDAEEQMTTQRLITALRIKTQGPKQRALSLSGGNQQKVVIAKWLCADSDILLLDEPTRGIDVGAKAEIYRLVRELSDLGKGVIFVSSDLEEVLMVSDMLLVLSNGRITYNGENKGISMEEVMRYATAAPSAGCAATN